MTPIIYIASKFILYVFWTYSGVRILRPNADSRFILATGYGTLRLIIGWAVGISLSLLANVAPETVSQSTLVYVAVLTPVRWLEWSIIAVLLAPSERDTKLFLVGRSADDRIWRAVGVGVSFIVDALIYFNVVEPQFFIC